MSLKRPFGRTLIEIMVASALLLLLTGASAVALRSSAQYFRRVENLTLMENQLLQVLGMISREIGETSARSLHWTDSPPALTFALPRNEAGQLMVNHGGGGNTLLFSSLVRYSVDPASRDLRRFIDSLPVPNSLAPHPINDLTPPRDEAYFADPTIDNRVLAQGVAVFGIEAVMLDPVNSTEIPTTDLERTDLLKVNLKLERTFDKTYSVRSRLELSPQN